MAPPMIWIIDDSPTVRKIVQVALHAAGFQVKTFADGAEVLRWAKSNQPVPDLILVDIIMPKLDGYEVIRHLRKRFQRLGSIPPFIVISRRDGLFDILKARLAGASDYVFKPFTPAQIIAVCNKHIRPK